MIVTALILQSNSSATRRPEEYLRDFRALARTGQPIVLFLDRSLSLPEAYANVRVEAISLADLPLHARLQAGDATLPSEGNPGKDTLDYLVIVNSKPYLLARAAELCPDESRFAWVDCGLARLLKNPDAALAKLARIGRAPRGITAPGALQAAYSGTHVPCWRYLGGFLIADRGALEPFRVAHERMVQKLLPQLTWEVNVWSLLEREGELGGNGIQLSWYSADHDDSMLDFPEVPPRVEPRLCVNMIVRNEAAIIERALASVAAVADCMVICDTGSTDDTAGVIQRFCDARGIPVELHHFPFETFSQARNEALARARASSLAFDYLLLLDADMQLVVSNDRWVEGLDSDAAHVMQEGGLLSYANVRLLRRHAEARYVGATHEALVVEGSLRRLEGAHFIDHADGANRPEKLKRDERLLRGELDANPADARSMYYLAQTLRDAGRHAEAAEWYERRLAAGGWEEERWHARYRAAQERLANGEVEAFVAGCLEAYAMRPSRAEPLMSLARHYAGKHQHDAALLAVEQAAAIPYPAQDTLFVEQDAYGDSLREMVSISGFYSAVAERREQGRWAAESLAIDQNVSDRMRATARSNLFYYARALGDLCAGAICQRLPVELPAPYVPTNPAIARDGDGFVAVVRGVNYRIDQGRYGIHDDRGVVRTRNFLARLHSDLTVDSLREMAEPVGFPRHKDAAVQGFEDCRLLRWRGRWHCSATARDLGGDGRARMVLLEIGDGGDFVSYRRLEGFGDHLHQKNWMPVPADEPTFVYGCAPAVRLQWDEGGGRVRVDSVVDPGFDLPHWRGGSPLLPWEGGYLGLVHEARDTPKGREYVHRFVRFDRAGVPVAASFAFWFNRPGIEFASGLAERAGEARPELLIAFGVNDCEAWLARVPRQHVASALVPLADMALPKRVHRPVMISKPLKVTC